MITIPLQYPSVHQVSRRFHVSRFAPRGFVDYDELDKAYAALTGEAVETVETSGGNAAGNAWLATLGSVSRGL